MDKQVAFAVYYREKNKKAKICECGILMSEKVKRCPICHRKV